MAAMLLLPFLSTELKAGSEVRPVAKMSTEIPESPRAKSLLTRLDEINAMDKSKLTSSEKKQLRKEVRSTKRELDELGGGIYISVGAIILILVLLIIFL